MEDKTIPGCAGPESSKSSGSGMPSGGNKCSCSIWELVQRRELWPGVLDIVCYCTVCSCESQSRCEVIGETLMVDVHLAPTSLSILIRVLRPIAPVRTIRNTWYINICVKVRATRTGKHKGRYYGIEVSDLKQLIIKQRKHGSNRGADKVINKTESAQIKN